MSKAEIAQFRLALLAWYGAHKRDLPWRRTGDPYAIWLSEVMLQQTRVAAVIPYFQRFLSRFPDLASLANAPEADLLQHWAGLGYYYRARNLQKAARSIMASGAFPRDYASIRDLPGIGDYTAAAVSSIAFNLPHAVVDGNVLRVLSRIWNDGSDIASGTGRKHFAGLADLMLDKSQPGTYNQALMELGAVVCLPKAPQCLLCPVSSHCKALAAGRAAELPVKRKEKNTVQQERTLFWIARNESLLVWQRDSSSRLMPGFWELPEREQLPAVQADLCLGEFKHGITIYDYRFKVVKAALPLDFGICRWRTFDELKSSPVSTIFRKAMRVVENPKAGSRVMKAVGLG